MTSSEQLPPDDTDLASTKAAERLAVIVDAAERAALSVIDDAEKEARRYLAEAQTRADRMVAERLREAADRLDPGGAAGSEPVLRPVEMAKAVEAAAEGADEDDNGTAAPAGARRQAPNPVRLSRTPSSPGPTPTPGTDSGSAAARLLATQMAVSGSSRKEIEMRLRAGFAIEDTGEILDAILGPEE